MEKGYVIYQLFLRAATRFGTLASAEKCLKHIAEAGATVVYLCPIFEADSDSRKEFWSSRQRASNFNNSKNPYRIKDYFKIDGEYGNDDDLKKFVKTAHKYGLSVILDLVYFHCGPNAEIIKINPDFVKRLPNGEIDRGEWFFPKLNYESTELCEYMWGNMEYFVREFGVDGYRCDVGDLVPLEFWKEGRRRITAIKPDAIMLDEGNNEEYIKSRTFDMEYHLKWGEDTLEQIRDNFTSVLGDISLRNRRVICFENHDAVNDVAENRLDKKHGNKLCNALLTVMFTCGCVPFIYNGNEIADTSRNSIFANRNCAKDMYIDWSGAITQSGKERFKLLKHLSHLYLNLPVIVNGDFEVINDSNGIIAYVKRFEGQELYVAVNLSKKLSKLPLCDEFDTNDAETLLSCGIIKDGNVLLMESGAYIVVLK